MPARTRDRWGDLADDPGLAPTERRSQRGPFVGRHGGRALRQFAREARLDRLLLDLQRGFGPQCWWPAETPFEVLVGAILTQNTAWANVERALAGLREKTELTPGRLLSLPEEGLAAAIRSSGYYRAKARKLRALSRWYLEVGGLVALREEPLEALRTALLAVHGVGPETADSILCYAAGRPTAVVDVYTRRILGRHGFVDAGAPYEVLRAWLQTALLPRQDVLEEFHALIVRAGHHHCGPKPRCEGCPTPAPARPAPTHKKAPRPGRS
jgi:endonuclease-3 related protein